MTPEETLLLLQLLIDLKIWKKNPPLTEGIFLAYIDAAFRPPMELKVTGFGSLAFWKAIREIFNPYPCKEDMCRLQAMFLD